MNDTKIPVVNRVIKNTLFLYVRMGVSILLSVFTTRILLQALGASDYGLYNVVAGVLSMLGFLSATMSSVTQRFISYAEGEGNNEKIKSIFNNALFLHWIIAGIVCATFILASFLFFDGILNIPDGRRSTAIWVYGCLIFSTVFSIVITPYDATLNAHENMKYYSLLGILDVTLKLIIAIAVFYTTSLDSLLVYGILMALESWALRIITQLYCQKNYAECKDTHIFKYANKTTLKEMTSFAGWNMLYVSTSMFALYSMTLILNHYHGTVMNAAMGIALQLTGVLMAVSTNMTKALTPIMVKKEGQGDRTDMITLSLIGCRYSFLLFSAVSIPVLMSLPTVLHIWLGDYPDWTQTFCSLFIVSNLLEQLFVFLYQTILANGNIKLYSIWKAVFCIIPIIVSIVMFEYDMPPYWLVFNWIIYVVLIGGIINIHFTLHLGLRLITYLKKVALPCMLTVVIMLLLCYGIRPLENQTLALQLTKLFIMVVLSLPVIWFTGILKNEKHQIIAILKTAKR